MTWCKAAVLCFTLSAGVLLAACQTDSRQQVLAVSKSQVALRSIQTRVFDTSDRKKTLETVVGTLQDLDFLVHNSDLILGTVSGTKNSGSTSVRITVTVRPRGGKQLLVRANAQMDLEAVDDPKPYQDFFSALGKAMFLTAHQVD